MLGCTQRETQLLLMTASRDHTMAMHFCSLPTEKKREGANTTECALCILQTLLHSALTEKYLKWVLAPF